MSEFDRIERLERALAGALIEIDRLKALEAIRDCIYRVCRGTDRIDENLLRSAFHPGAKVHFGRLYDGDVDGWIASAIEHQKRQSQAQHMVGNIHIKIDGNEAVAESYELDRHKTPMNGEVLDLVLGMRTLDRFALRDGEWRILERTKVMDWGRAIAGNDAIFEHSAVERGRNDDCDASYVLFG